MNAIQRMITGKYSLIVTFWYFSVPFLAVLGLVGRFGELRPGSAQAIIYVVICVTSSVFCAISVWNSAGSYGGPPIWKWLARLQSLVALAVVSSFSLMLGTSLTSKKASDTQYYVYSDKGSFPNCTSTYEDKEYLVLEFQVRPSQNQVIQKAFVVEDKTTDIRELKDCSAFDEMNWTCGGKRLDLPALGGALCHMIGSKTEMINGVLKDTPFRYVDCDFPSHLSASYCSSKIVAR